MKSNFDKLKKSCGEIYLILKNAIEKGVLIKITDAVKKLGKYGLEKVIKNVLLYDFTGKAETLRNGPLGICE